MSKTPTHVAQAQGELDNARAYGQGDAVRAAEKRLAAAGVRRADADADDDDAARARAPKGRTSAPRHTTQAKQPPTSGPGSGVEAWRAYAAKVSGEPPEMFAEATREQLVGRFGA